MNSSWGKSFGSSWANSWGAIDSFIYGTAQIVAYAEVRALGGFNRNANASIVAYSTVTALSNVEISTSINFTQIATLRAIASVDFEALANFYVEAQFRANGYIIGKNWTENSIGFNVWQEIIPSETERWVCASVNDNTWRQIDNSYYVDLDYWIEGYAEANVSKWTENEMNANRWVNK
jgi:hypothetical protein